MQQVSRKAYSATSQPNSFQIMFPKPHLLRQKLNMKVAAQNFLSWNYCQYWQNSKPKQAHNSFAREGDSHLAANPWSQQVNPTGSISSSICRLKWYRKKCDLLLNTRGRSWSFIMDYKKIQINQPCVIKSQALILMSKANFANGILSQLQSASASFSNSILCSIPKVTERLHWPQNTMDSSTSSV